MAQYIINPTNPQGLSQQVQKIGIRVQPSISAKRKAGQATDDPTNPNHEPNVKGASSPTLKTTLLKTGEISNGADPFSPKGHSNKGTTSSPIPHPNTQTYVSPINTPETTSGGEISTATNNNRVPYLVLHPLSISR